MAELNRKLPRLKGFDYSQNGVYFVTFCVKDRHCVLSTIVGSDALGAPCGNAAISVNDDPNAPMVYLKPYGCIVENEIIKMNRIYDNVEVINFVIMPNHVHLLVRISNGASRATLPTQSVLSTYVGTLKRFCNKAFGRKIWQASYYDHIIRDDEDLFYHWQYINENPKKWLIGKDKYYT